MKRAISWVGVVLLIGSAACGDDDASTDAQDGGVAPATGSTECPEFEPLGNAIGRFAGNWLVDDDAQLNNPCPNSTVVVLEGYPQMGWPKDPTRNKTCPAPSALFMISNTAVKDCAGDPPVCSSAAEALTFYIHAWPKASLKGKAREELFANETLIAHSNNEWNVLDNHIFVHLGKTQEDDVLTPSGVTQFKRTLLVRGDCTAQ